MQKQIADVAAHILWYVALGSMTTVTGHKVTLNPFMPTGLFYLNYLDFSSSSTGVVWLLFIMIMFCRKF